MARGQSSMAACSEDSSSARSNQRARGGALALRKAVAVSDAGAGVGADAPMHLCQTAKPCPRVEICRPALDIHTAMAAMAHSGCVETAVIL